MIVERIEVYANCELLQVSPQGLSKERRGLQGDENTIENAEQELEPKKCPSCSPCSVVSILFSNQVPFVNAWYGLGQVLISLDCNYEYHNCYSN